MRWLSRVVELMTWSSQWQGVWFLRHGNGRAYRIQFRVVLVLGGGNTFFFSYSLIILDLWLDILILDICSHYLFKYFCSILPLISVIPVTCVLEPSILSHSFWMFSSFLLFQRLYLFIFRERGRERETSGCDCLSRAPCWGPGPNPGMCPDWEFNQRHFGSQACAQSIELHQPGLFYFYFYFFHSVFSQCFSWGHFYWPIFLAELTQYWRAHWRHSHFS